MTLEMVAESKSSARSASSYRTSSDLTSVNAFAPGILVVLHLLLVVAFVFSAFLSRHFFPPALHLLQVLSCPLDALLYVLYLLDVSRDFLLP